MGNHIVGFLLCGSYIFPDMYFQEFCNFDDYNWDWTLQHLSHKCIPGTMKVLKMKATRVFHMGDWLVYAMHEQMSYHFHSN